MREYLDPLHYRTMRSSRLGDLGFDPVITPALIGAGATLVGSSLNIGSKMWGQKAVQAAQEEQLKNVRLQQRREQEALQRAMARQAEAIAREEALKEQEALIQEARARRGMTAAALYAIGGVTVIGVGILVFAAMRKPKPKETKP